MFALRFAAACRHQIVVVVVAPPIQKTAIRTTSSLRRPVNSIKCGHSALSNLTFLESHFSHSATAASALKYGSNMSSNKRINTKNINLGQKAVNVGVPGPSMALSARVQLCIVGNGANANPAAVAVITDHETLLFNCGEGVQRLLMEHKIRVTKIKHVFFTSLRPESFTGFFGFLLTLATSVADSQGGHFLTVHAPKERFQAISQLYSRFTYHGTKNLLISYRDIDPHFTECGSGSSSEESSDSLENGSRPPIRNPLYPELNNTDGTAPATNTKVAVDVFQKYKSVSQQTIDQQEDLEEELDENKDTRRVLIDNADLRVVSFRIWSVARRFPHSFAYVLMLKDKPGQLLVEKVKAMGVPPGPLYAKLKAGQTITTAAGKTVSPADVLGPAEPGPAFIIVECPTLNHTHSLITNSDLKKLLVGRDLRVIVHIAPEHVFSNTHYQRWVTSFPNSVKHIPVGSNNRSEPCLITSSSAQVKLNAVDETVFRTLSEQPPPEIEVSPKKNKTVGGDGVTTFQMAAKKTVLADAPTMLTYTFRPTREQPFSYSPASSRVKPAEEILKETMEDADFAAKLAEYRAAVAASTPANASTPSKASSKSPSSGKEPNKSKFKPSVLFLGTASATPGKQRNTSAILVNLRKDASILLDCGEATFLQLQRFYGQQATKDLLARLRAIFISHNHADHHFGLVRLLRERENELVERGGRVSTDGAQKVDAGPLLLIAPDCISEFLLEFGNEVIPLENLHRHYRIIRHEDLLFERELTEAAAASKRRAMAALGLSELVTVRVPHCQDSHGIVLTTKGGEKIAYTGDTLFSNAFDRAALDASLLIHEATMNDDLAEEAQLKRHTTISQAIRAGFNCRAKFTMLTHFSQRYAKIAPVDQLKNEGEGGGEGGDDKAVASELAKYSVDNVGFAFDFMHLELDQLWRAAKMRPLLETLFSDDIQEMSEKREKTALKRKLVAGDEQQSSAASSSSSRQ